MAAVSRLANVRSTARRNLLRVDVLVWALPPAVAWFVRNSADAPLAKVIGALVAAGIICLSYRSPGRGLLVLAAVLPFQLVGFPLLYHYGVPGSIMRPLGGWKEAIGLGILAAGVQAIIRERRPLDRVDRIALAYVGLVVTYFLFPSVLVRARSFTFAGPPLDLSPRLLGLRADAGFVLLFFGVRHADIPRVIRRRFVQVVAAVTCVYAALAVFQYLRPADWLDFVENTAQLPRFQTEVLGFSGGVVDTLHWLHVRPVRATSLMISPFDLGDYLLVTLGIGVENLLRRSGVRWLHAATMLASVALLLTFTRASILAAAVLGLVALRPRSGRTEHGQVRMALVLVALMLVALPGLASTRLSGAEGGSDSSSEHVRELRTGFNKLFREPLGTGLGSATGVGERFDSPDALISDNSYFQVGNELGITTMIAFIVLLVAVVGALGRVPEPTALSGGIRGALIALMVTGLFHHVWTSFPLPWTVWAAAGLCLSRSSASQPASHPLQDLDRPAPDAAGRGLRWPATVDIIDPRSRA